MISFPLQRLIILDGGQILVGNPILTLGSQQVGEQKKLSLTERKSSSKETCRRKRNVAKERGGNRSLPPLRLQLSSPRKESVNSPLKARLQRLQLELRISGGDQPIRDLSVGLSRRAPMRRSCINLIRDRNNRLDCFEDLLSRKIFIRELTITVTIDL